MTTTETDAPAPEPAADELDAGGDEPLAIEARGRSAQGSALDPADPARSRCRSSPRSACCSGPSTCPRAFLAGGKTGALVIVLIVTLSIMAGAAAMSRDAAPAHVVEAAHRRVRRRASIVSAGIVSARSERGEGIGRRRVRASRRARRSATIEVDALPERLTFKPRSSPPRRASTRSSTSTRAPAPTPCCSTSPQFTGFELNVGPPKTESGKVQLKKGTTTRSSAPSPGHGPPG